MNHNDAAYAHGYSSTRECLADASYAVKHGMQQDVRQALATMDASSPAYWVLVGSSVALDESLSLRAA